MTGFAGKRGWIWRFLASWVIPLIMSGAYIILMYTSETDTKGKLWEAGGLAAVLFLWWLFRRLTSSAAMTRAIAVGDAERVLELADGRPVYRALAFEIRGEWPAVLRELDGLTPTGTERVLAATAKIAALAATERAADARAVYDRDLVGAAIPRDLEMHVRLAEARVRLAEGDRAGAHRLLDKIANDIRAGERLRELAQALRSNAL